MGKVYFKVKFDKSINMDIPHSLNIATALYGFRELGACLFHIIVWMISTIKLMRMILF